MLRVQIPEPDAGFAEIVRTGFADFAAASSELAFPQYDDVWLSSNVINAVR